MRRTLTLLLALAACLSLSVVPVQSAEPPKYSRAAMTPNERTILPDALGKVTKAGQYLGIDVKPGDILLPASSPEDSTTASTEDLAKLPADEIKPVTGGLSPLRLLKLLGARPAMAACGDVVVLHASQTDVLPVRAYRWRRLGAIGEDTCDKITAYYRARMVQLVNDREIDIPTYHINDQITLRHEDRDTGGDGCGYVDQTGYSQDGGPCYGTINPDDHRGSDGNPVVYYIRHGAFHAKGYQDRWQTYGAYNAVYFPDTDVWSAYHTHCSNLWTAGSTLVESRLRIFSACQAWYA